MNNDIVILYRAYYHNILIAVSINKYILKEYMKNTRNLDSNDFNIEECTITTDDIINLYEQYYLEEYLKDLYLPRRDCEILDKEVQNEFDHFVKTLNDMRYYYQRIKYIDIMEKHAKQLAETIHNMEEDLTTKKTLKKLRKRIVRSSMVLSSNINEYLSTLKIEKESKELRTEYLYKVYCTD